MLLMINNEFLQNKLKFSEIRIDNIVLDWDFMVGENILLTSVPGEKLEFLVSGENEKTLVSIS
jgi:hypothetical protein